MTYLYQSPCLHNECILQAVYNEAIHFFLHENWSLSKLFQNLHSFTHNCRISPCCWDDFHQGDIVRRIQLEREGEMKCVHQKNNH